ncbi:lysine--tRNA ligase [Candidatus Sneabacter namystus]|uniref:Lysine--tRNA ligase n=1 Tax=Candidatus Sneabacter namystus TaxID=2601646 RepID=A0A5C0UJ89_9RICK|nr:lysine--tRNA ligase [Candidatus Sneabacter namystus]QEK39859.1 lysine--tRNA ligase [Candidatus Sneabacter namystus]
MHINKEHYIQSKAWPFQLAKKLHKRIQNTNSQKDIVSFETGYGPSGLPHIGTFGEVSRTNMIIQAFQKICDIPTKLICFSDDLDGMRKIPENVPNQEMLRQHLHKPLSHVPDPFCETKSFGDYMNKQLKSFLDKFGFSYDFYSATQCYSEGLFDEYLLKVLKKYDEIMNVMLPSLREERRKTYSPFLPICPTTGKVLQVKVETLDTTNGTITYINTDTNKHVTVPVTKGNCKLQWKPDFGMRWAALKIDLEIHGKEHAPNADIYSKICKILGGRPPVLFCYELFLDEQGEKISKSKGNGIEIDRWLQYAPLESLQLFLYKNPERAKKLHMGTIASCVDEYLMLNEKYHSQNIKQKLENPVYHIHNGQVPIVTTHGITFSTLINLVESCNVENKDMIWSFIKNYDDKIVQETDSYLDKLIKHAIAFVKAADTTKEYSVITDDIQRNILQQLKQKVLQLSDATAIQKEIYAIGMLYHAHDMQNYFQFLYKTLLGKNVGPRLGSLLSLLGKEKSINLIDSALTRK